MFKRNMLYFMILLFLCHLPGSNLFAQTHDNAQKIPQDIKPSDVIHWQPFAADLFPDNTAAIYLRLTTEKGFSIFKEKLEFANEAGFVVQNISFPPSTIIADEISGTSKEVFYGGEFVLNYKGTKKYNQATFPIKVSYVGCAGLICLNKFTEVFAIATVNRQLSEKTENLAANSVPEQNGSAAEKEKEAGAGFSSDDWQFKWAQKIQAGAFDFWFLLLIVFFGGMLTNLTPCVYPMIPITIRLLGGQGKKAVLSSTCYSAGIIFTYTSLGVVAGLSGSLFGTLLASNWVNIVFAVIMIALGVSMIGLFDFSMAQNLASKLGTGKPSPRNAFLMGIGAGFVASPCTGPILAALLAYTAKEQNVAKATSLLFTYSLGFALPYVFLGSAAAKINKMKISPNLQSLVKVLFSAIMLALGFYYLRVPIRGLYKLMNEYWAIIFAVTGLLWFVCLIVWWFRASLKESKAFSILMMLFLGVGIFSGVQSITENAGGKTGGSHSNWLKSEAEGLAASSQQKAPILIDNWAEWCEACKKMDVTTFQDKEVLAFLEQKGWVLVKLDLTEDNEQNQKIQDKYGFPGLPTIVILPPGGDLKRKKLLSGYISSKTLIEELTQFYKLNM